MALQPPPRDSNMQVLPHDHPEILNQDGIIRRISEQHLINDEKTGGRRISSMALKTSSGENGGLSVDLKRHIEEAGLNPQTYVTTPRWIGSLLFEAIHFRQLDMLVGFDPLVENPYHAQVWGDLNKKKNQKILLGQCKWFVQIHNVSIV